MKRTSYKIIQIIKQRKSEKLAIPLTVLCGFSCLNDVLKKDILLKQEGISVECQMSTCDSPCFIVNKFEGA